MDPLEACSQHRPDAEQHGALGGPVAGTARAVLGAGEHDERRPLLAVLHGRVVHRHHFGAGQQPGHAPLRAWHEEVADADVGEGAAGHHPVVAAAGSVAVEVGRRHAVLHQERAGRTRLGDAARGGDVVGGHAVAEGEKHAGSVDARGCLWLPREFREERRFLDVGARLIPVVEFTRARRHRIPPRVRFPDIVVALLKLPGHHARLDGGADLLGGRPDVLEKHRRTIRADPERLGGEIDVGGAGQRVGHHQRRAGEPVGLHEGIHAALEVAVAGEHRGRDEVALGDRGGHVIGERPRVADAGRAAVAHRLEAEGVEILGQARLLEVIGDHAGAGSQARLHPRLRGEPLGDRLSGDEPGGHHHAGIARVGAAGDGGDHHGTVADLIGAAVLADRARASERRPLEREAPLGRRRGERFGEGPLHLHERHAVLRPLRAGEARHHAPQVERQPLGELGDRGSGGAKHPLLLHVPLDERHLLGRPAGEPQVGQGLVVHGEEAHRGPVLGGHVGDRGPVGERHALETAPEELDELSDHPILPQDLGDREHQVGGGGAGGQAACEFKPDHLGQEQRQRLAEHHGLGFDATYPPADHPESVDHRGVAVGADERVGHGHLHGPLARRIVAEKHAAGEVLQIHLMDDADRRGHDAKVAKRLLAPPQEGVPLGIAAKLDVDVFLERVVRPEEVHLHRVVDDEIHRHERIDLSGIATESLHRRPHRRQVDHARHPGEVLQHDPGRLEGDLLLGRLGGIPGCERADVGLGDLVVVTGPQQGLEDHPDRVRQPRRGGDAGIVERLEAIERGGARAGVERGPGRKRVGRGGSHGCPGGVKGMGAQHGNAGVRR